MGHPSHNEGVLIALDWGTTNVRAALLDKSGSVIEERRGESGVGTFSAKQFADRFDELTHGWPGLPAIAAGMVGSRQGWHEADYLPCPVSAAQIGGATTRFDHKGRTVSIVPGVKFQDGKRCDVMRGEESQLAGFLVDHPHHSGHVIMPGTHSKWVQLKSGVIESFQTYMTGELFHAISNNTILAHSVSQSENCGPLFADKVRSVLDSDRSPESALFGMRARHLLEGLDKTQLYLELSALLIVAELRAAERDGHLGDEDLVLIGSAALTQKYQIALQAMGKTCTCVEGTSLVWTALFSLAHPA